jgi:hypothetical protein
MVDLSQLSDSDLLSLATKLKEAEANTPRDPLALSQAQLHAASGGVLEGLPVVGPYVKEGAERLGAKYDAATGAAPSEADALTQRKLATEKADIQNPGAALAGRTIGGVAGTAPLVAAAPAAFGAGTAPLVLRTGASMLSGGALSGADAAVRSGGDPVQTGIGAGVGAVAGPVGMGVSSLYGKAAAAVADRLGGLTNPGGALSGISKAALRYASDAIGDPIKMAALQAEIKRLGPQATLADVSPEWFGVARGAASRPGMRDDIVNPLLARNDTKNQRLAADLNALGRPIDPTRIEAEIQQAQQALSPDYERVIAGARAVDTRPLANRLDVLATNERGPAQRAARQIRDMLDVTGSPGTLDPHPRVLLNTRQAIDGILKTETDPNAVRVLSAARRYVDDQLTRAAPGIKDVDAFHQELARQREALNIGGTVFDTGKTVSRPAAFAEDFVRSANPEGTLVGPSAAPFRQQQGARAEMDRIVGTKANDPLAMQSAVKSEGDYPRDKLRTMFGGRADQALNAIDREAQFARTGGRITAGSDTAVTNQFGNFLNEASKPLEIPKGVTVLDLLGKGAEAGARKLFGIDPEAKARRFAEELGKLSVAQGAERDAYMRSLLDLVNKRGVLTPIENNAKEAMRALIISAASNRAPFKAP